jgi:hypothetical protein
MAPLLWIPYNWTQVVRISPSSVSILPNWVQVPLPVPIVTFYVPSIAAHRATATCNLAACQITSWKTITGRGIPGCGIATFLTTISNKRSNLEKSGRTDRRCVALELILLHQKNLQTCHTSKSAGDLSCKQILLQN